MNEVMEIRGGQDLTAHGGFTDELRLRFIAYLDAAPQTVSTYSRALRQMMRFFAQHGITAPQRADILAYRDELRATRTPATVQNYITAARRFFAWTEQEHIYPNVAEHIKGAKLSKDHKKDCLTSSQVKTLLSGMERGTLQGKRNYAIATLMITGGLRTVEVARANLEDLRTVGDMPVLYIQGKGQQERTEYVKLSEPVEAAIRDYLISRASAGGGSSPLFESLSNNSRGHRMTTRAISGIIKHAMTEAGYSSPRLTAHSLRHTAVTLSLLAGESLEEVQQFARHANIATTMIYNHALDRAKNGCSDVISRAIF